jgi:hypothetical protein
MKTNFFTILILFIIDAQEVQAQYLPTLIDDRIWQVSGYYQSIDYRLMFDVYQDGVFEFEGQEYAVIKANYSETEERTLALIREDTILGKLWIRAHLHGQSNIYIDTSEEILLADYSLNEGDQFFYTYFTWFDDVNGAGFSKDSVLLTVQETGLLAGRRYVEMNNLSYNGIASVLGFLSNSIMYQSPIAHVLPLRFIEGIGPSFSICSQISPMIEFPYDPYVLCVTENELEVWHDPYIEDCYNEGVLPLLILGLDDNAIKKTYTVFPNPAKDIISIKILDGTLLKAEIREVSGKKLLSKQDFFAGNQNHITIDHLQSGVYILRLTIEWNNQQEVHQSLIVKL